MSDLMGFGPGGIDCSDVIKDVFLYLDDETDPAARERIQAHLDACSPCLRHFGLEQDVISLVARCCGGDVAPVSLHQRVRVRLTEVSIEISHVEYRAE